MHVVQDIDGTNIARGLADAEQCQLILVAPSGFVNGVYFPAESLTFTSLEGVATLHRLCEQLMEVHMEAAQRVG